MFTTVFSMHSIGFLLRAKNTEVGYYVSLQTQGSVCVNTLQQVEKFKYLGVVFTSLRKAERGD